MPVTTQSGPPKLIEAGNSYIFTESYSQYPATLWTMKFVLNNTMTGAPTTVIAGASGLNFLVTLTTTITSALTAGLYDWVEYLTEIASSQRTTGNTGSLNVIADISQPIAPSFAQAMVTQLETIIQQLASAAFQTVNFAGQSYTPKDITKLQQDHTYWQATVFRERDLALANRGVDTSGRIQPAFKSGQGTFVPFDPFNPATR